MKKFILKNWPAIIILAASLVISWPLFIKGYFSHHDDIQIIRIFEMRRCLQDLQIPCRWVPDMGYGYGFPLFNYYGVLPYYIGALFSFLTGYIVAAKLLFFFVLVFGGISVYLLSSELFGKKAGILSGILYLFAPYRALDTYARGAITELFAISLIPIVFYFGLRLSRKYSITNFLCVTVFLGLFLINHNIMSMFFIPVYILWVILLTAIEGKRNLRYQLFSFILGLGFSAFFILPAYFETNLVHIENLKQSMYIPNFRAHFISLRQLFLDRSWGWGTSTWLEEDTLSFQIGWPHWWLVVLSGILIFLNIFKISFNKIRILKINRNELIVLAFFSSVFIGSVFMTHNKSTFIWESIEQIQYAQFPWRFLGVSIFAASLLGGALVTALPKKIINIFILITALLTIFLNWQYFKPKEYYFERGDKDYLSGELWDFQKAGSIFDYLPKNADVPKSEAPDTPYVLSGKAIISNYLLKTNYWSFNTDVNGRSGIEVPVFDYPKWKVMANGKNIDYSVSDSGLINIYFDKGFYKVEGSFKNTPIRTISNTISLLSILILVGYYGYEKFKGYSKK